MGGIFILVFGFVDPLGYGLIGIVLFENSSAEQEDGIAEPQDKEDDAGDNCVLQGAGCEIQQQQQRCDHDHSREIGKNVQAGGGGAQPRIDLFH